MSIGHECVVDLELIRYDRNIAECCGNGRRDNEPHAMSEASPSPFDPRQRSTTKPRCTAALIRSQ